MTNVLMANMLMTNALMILRRVARDATGPRSTVAR
jgi:hypothetical protein